MRATRSPLKVPMSEDERKELVRSAAEVHSKLRGIFSRLHRWVALEAPALPAAVKAERVSLRLMRELQRLELDDPGLSCRREALAKLRRFRLWRTAIK